ncbi:uncharacterized protein LACBIDRAFT_327289 [Laccaria bicolor S238N-H82]|uniref:Predicted protein n=1 Tax=Laccaria bicolor (strain S238N-H82 / ATCC MYA-4686) TaxID=486041 RepID=B0DBS0_LACBS|nr:uncharacterized protein LACBIDRAFT_327289 [Laccaria bicolor S238N-H82]EDR08230.1 predicted protein [Laccaria bicolor S238N-H82]|eukprot:XP_001881300.1 predicted protein [Laccaria bicolor S238N-H82]
MMLVTLISEVRGKQKHDRTFNGCELSWFYRSVKASTQKCPSNDSEWHDLYTQLAQLHRIVYVLGSYYDAILTLPGLVKFLKDNVNVGYAINDIRNHTNDIHDDNESDDRSDALSDIGVDDHEDAGKFLMRYFRAIVAWNQAYAWLDSSKLFRSLKGIMSLNIVKMQVPSEKCQAVTSTSALLDEFTDDPVIRESLQDLERFGGKFTGDANKIGVAKKCCWLCKELGEAMGQNNQTFSLPGTSGLVFSWAPPTGLDIAVLQQLEDRLKNRLFKYLEKYAKQALEQVQSHQLSPTTSVTDITLPGHPITKEIGLGWRHEHS